MITSVPTLRPYNTKDDSTNINVKLKLPKIKNIFENTKVKHHNRLFYGNKNSKNYGRIPHLLNEVKAKLDNLERDDKKKHKKSSQIRERSEVKNEDEVLPEEEKLTRTKLINYKREIFLSKLSVEMKNETLKSLRDFVKSQESQLDEQVRRTTDLNVAMQRFIKEQ